MNLHSCETSAQRRKGTLYSPCAPERSFPQQGTPPATQSPSSTHAAHAMPQVQVERPSREEAPKIASWEGRERGTYTRARSTWRQPSSGRIHRTYTPQLALSLDDVEQQTPQLWPDPPSSETHSAQPAFNDPLETCRHG
jgi:hypothetical protein